jgi:hypothetical protein
MCPQSHEFETKEHELHWMLSDAMALRDSGRTSGAILLLLCAVDALAARAYPNSKEVGRRFKPFLKSKIRRSGLPQVWNIYVPSRKELLPFEDILYKYLRNPILHEGARLELDYPANYTVRIDWYEISRGIKVDSENNQLILGGELIMDLLADAVLEGFRNG